MATQRAFLQFVAEKALAGESDGIKDYTVATQVFGRRENLDQATDSIVSIQANKLRRALEHYYLDAGNQDPIRIDIPKDTQLKLWRGLCGRWKDHRDTEKIFSDIIVNHSEGRSVNL